MADQFKNEIVGEVSSPTTEENMTAPEIKEPEVSAPQAENAPASNGAEGDSRSENAPKRKLPVFREDLVEPISGENVEVQMPQRREPIIKQRDRKLPVFADEVKKYAEEDEFEDDIDFTSDSIAMPFTLGATTTAMGVDVSEATNGKGKKKKKKDSASKSVDDLVKAHMKEADKNDKILRSGLGKSTGYYDVTSSAGSTPTYEKENAIMAKHYGVKNAEFESSANSPFVSKTFSGAKTASSKKSKRNYADVESNELMAAYIDEKNREKVRSYNVEQADMTADNGIAEAEALLADNKRRISEGKGKGHLYSAYSEKEDKFDTVFDRDYREIGIKEAEALLEDSDDYKSSNGGYGHLYSVYSEENGQFDNVFDADNRELGVVEAEVLLALAADEKQKAKALKALKRAAAAEKKAEKALQDNNSDVTKVVVEAKANASVIEEINEPIEAENDSVLSLTEQNTINENDDIITQDVVEEITAEQVYDTAETEYIEDTVEPEQIYEDVVEAEPVVEETYDVAETEQVEEIVEPEQIYEDVVEAEPVVEETYDVAETEQVEEIVEPEQTNISEETATEKEVLDTPVNIQEDKTSEDDVVLSNNNYAESYDNFVKTEAEDGDTYAQIASTADSDDVYNNDGYAIDENEVLYDEDAEKAELLSIANAEKQIIKDEKATVNQDASEIAFEREMEYSSADFYEASEEYTAFIAENIDDEEQIAAEKYTAKELKKLKKAENKALRQAEREELLAVAAAEAQRVKEEKAAKKAAKAEEKAKKADALLAVQAEETKKSDTNTAEEQKKIEAKAEEKAEHEELLAVVNAEEQKAKEQAAAEKTKAESENKAEREELLAVAEAEDKKAKEQAAEEKTKVESENKAEHEELLEVANAEEQKAKEEAEEKVVSNETVASDISDKETSIEKENVASTADEKTSETAEEISVEAYELKEQKKLAKAEAKAEKQAEREELLAVAAAEKQRIKDEKAAKKAEKKANTETAPENEATNDSNETSNDASKADTVAKQEESKSNEETSIEAYELKEQKKASKEEAKALKQAEREELLAVAAAEKQRIQDEKTVAKEQKKASKEEAKALKQAEREELLAVAAAEKQRIKDEKKETAEKSDDSKMEKNVKDASSSKNVNKSEASTEAYTEKEQRDEEKREAKAEKKAERQELLAVAAAEKQENKAKEESESPVDTKSEVAYSDFDLTGYDPDWKANAKAAEEKAKAAEKEAKQLEREGAKAEAAEKRDESNQLRYEAHEDSRLYNKEEEKAYLLTYKEEVEAQKQAKAEAKEAAKAAALAAATAVAPVAEYAEYTETFDKEAYDANKKAIEDAKAQAKADAEAEKAAKKAEAKANAEAEAVENYNEYTDIKLTKSEERAEMLAANKAEVEAQKQAKAEAKEVAKAAAIAAAAAVAPVADYADFTETFDKEAYDADKKAIEDAKAQAKADSEAEKAAKKAEKAAESEAKISESYDKYTDEKLTKSEERADMLSVNKAEVEAQKQAKAEAKEVAKTAAALAAAAAAAATVEEFADFTELFDKEAYDADKKAIADAKAQAKADAEAEKAAKKAEAKANAEAKAVENYNQATDSRITKSEERAEMLSFNKKAVSEEKQAKEAAREAAKAATLAAVTVASVEEYADFTETFDKEAYDADKKAQEDAIAKAKADARIAKAEQKTAKEAKAEEKISELYDKQIAKKEQIADFVAFNEQAEADRKQLQENAKAKRSSNLAKSDAAPETVYADPEYLSDDLMDEIYRGSSAETKDILKQQTNDLLTIEEMRREAQEHKDQSAIATLEKHLSNDEMLDFAESYEADIKRNKKRLERAEKYGKFMLEYGSTFDPEWDGEFNNYGLPEKDPYTDGVKLSTSRRRTQKRERLTGLDEKRLSTLSKDQCDLDNRMVTARVEAEFIDLELDVARVEQEFSGEYRSSKEKRWLRDSKKKLKTLKHRIASAVKYEKLDNERYYSVVATDFDRVELPEKADRQELIEMREELMRLLDIRDEINMQLIELYTGNDDGSSGKNHIYRRSRAVLKARKREHRRYLKHYGMLNQHQVTRNEKMRIFDKMDEVVELKGELAKINYILRKEKPEGKVRRSCIKEKQITKRDIRIARVAIERMTIRALRKARRRERRMRAMTMAYTTLVILGMLAFTIFALGPQILEALKGVIPQEFHTYIDNILNNWPF